jgi:hypothetical protein
MWVGVVLLVVAVLVVLAGVFGLIVFFTGAERTNRALRRIPPSKIAAMQSGSLARVVGKLKPGNGPLLLAPLSGKRCGYFQAVAQEWRQSGKLEGWVQLTYEEQWCDFCLDDGSGQVLVRMLRPEVSADLEEASFSDHIVPPSRSQESFLRRHMVGPPQPGQQAPKIKYLECLFELDEEITAYGVVRHEQTPDGPRIVLEAPEGEPLLVSDDRKTTRRAR